ncbi:MAG: hypothetical protein N4A70_00045 [Pelagimonas sp.]|jgi:hypothetical protein|nr:hypothetical protein [Pelagimonas sp.]
MRILIEAPLADVTQTLSESLSSDELSALQVSEPRRDPFAPQSQGDLPTLQTVVEFAAGAIAGGILHDGAKALVAKVGKVLKARYGEKASVEDDDGEDDPDGTT